MGETTANASREKTVPPAKQRPDKGHTEWGTLMWKINIQDDLRISFPARDDSFSEGVEIGMLATLMSMGGAEFSRSVSLKGVEQAKRLGEKLGYHIAAMEPEEGEMVRLTFRERSQRARLTVIAGRGEAGPQHGSLHA